MTLGCVTLLKLLGRANLRLLLHSLADNYLCYGGDMSGVIALAAALKDSQIVNLK